jgi:hypothetical protein
MFTTYRTKIYGNVHELEGHSIIELFRALRTQDSIKIFRSLNNLTEILVGYGTHILIEILSTQLFRS